MFIQQTAKAVSKVVAAVAAAAADGGTTVKSVVNLKVRIVTSRFASPAPKAREPGGRRSWWW